MAPIPTSWGSRYTFSRSCWPRVKMPGSGYKPRTCCGCCLVLLPAANYGAPVWKTEVTNAAVILMLLCFEILLYVVFVYGNVPAFGLGLLAVLLQVKYFKSRNTLSRSAVGCRGRRRRPAQEQ